MKAQLLEDIGDAHHLPPHQPPQAWRRAAPQAAPQATHAPAAPPPMPPRTPQADAWQPSEHDARLADEAPGAEDWFDRWGRRAAGWMAVLVAAVLVAGAGWWLHDENKTDNTLQVLAKAPLPLPQSRPAVGTGTAPPVASPPAEAAAQLAAADPAATREPDAVHEPGAAREPVGPGEPAALGESAAPGASAAPRGREATRAARLAAVRAAKAARAAQAGQSIRAAAQPPSASSVAETLRQCRAVGYHAARCVQLGCEATKFGLACKGSAARR